MNCLRYPLFLNPNLSVARQPQLLSPSLFSYYLLYLLIRLRNHHLQFSFVKFASFISSSYQGKISQEKGIKIREVFWEDKMSCKCEIFFGFPPLQRSFFFNPVRRFINASYFLSLLLREVSVLTTSTPCSGISFPSASSHGRHSPFTCFATSSLLKTNHVPTLTQNKHYVPLASNSQVIFYHL